MNKWLISLYALVIAVIVFNPYTFMLTNQLRHLSPHLATTDRNGKPTCFGYVLHYVVFFLLSRLVMEF